MSEINYYVIDTETTGLDCVRQEMIEIGIIREKDKVQLCRTLKADYPERASLDALAITNRTLADLEKGEDREKVVRECHDFLLSDGLTPAHRCIVGHNIQFDRKFLHAEWEKVGLEFPAHLWLCTMEMTKSFVKNAGIDVENKKLGLPKQKVNLHASLDLLKVRKLSDSHDAKSDSRNTYLLRNGLMQANVDHLSHMKTFIHQISPQNNYDDDEGFEDQS